jgi:hypothetical protein
MTEANSTASTFVPLVDGQCLMGQVKAPFIKGDKLLGAILSFEGRSETALLHIRQMSGENNLARLSELGEGDSLLVRIVIQEDSGRRQIWATEKGVEHQLLIEKLESEPEKLRGVQGKVQGVTAGIGVFVELLEGTAIGRRGLLRFGVTARVKLGAYVAHKVGDLVLVDIAEVRVDDANKLLIRIENVRPQVAA